MRVSSIGDGRLENESRKYTRHAVGKSARIQSSGMQTEGSLIDASHTGVAVQSSQFYENDLFIELQIEGTNSLSGRVVRNFQGGFALELAEEDRLDDKALEELAKFKAIKGNKTG